MSLCVDVGLCNGCGVCVARCPTDVIRLDEKRLPYIAYEECWYCGVCEADCPEKALIVELPFLIR